MICHALNKDILADLENALIERKLYVHPEGREEMEEFLSYAETLGFTWGSGERTMALFDEAIEHPYIAKHPFYSKESRTLGYYTNPRGVSGVTWRSVKAGRDAGVDTFVY